MGVAHRDVPRRPLSTQPGLFALIGSGGRSGSIFTLGDRT